MTAADLDVPTLLRTVQAIATEVRLPALLSTIMRLALENAGADQGALIVEEEGRWAIEAIGHADRAPEIVAQPQPIDGSCEVSEPIVQLVVHTRGPIVLNDALRESRFAHDPHIRRTRPHSILCMPLMHQGQLRSIVYLENTSTTGAFAQDRVAALSWLSRQMATAIDRARLYHSLEAKVAERTRELRAEIAMRQQVEEALRHQERLFRTLVENSPDMISRFDRDFRRLYVSPAALYVAGRAPDELVGRTSADLGYPRHLYALWQGMLAQVFETGQPVSYETELPTPERRVPVQTRLAPEFAADGSVESVVGITSDITELKEVEQVRRQAEHETATAEARFRGLLEMAPDATVVTDGEGRITLINRQTEALFGYPRAELLGQLVEVLIPERFHEGHRRHRTDYAADPRTRPMGANLELFGRRKDGSELPVEVSLSPLETAGDMVVITTIRDVTEHKRTAQAMRLAKESAEAARHQEEARRHEAERRRQAAESLRDVLAILNSDRELEEVLDCIGQQANRLLGSRATIIYRLPRTHVRLPLLSVVGAPRRPLIESYLPVSPDMLRRLPVTNGVVAIPDMAAIPAVPIEVEDAKTDGAAAFIIPIAAPFRAVLAAPISIRGEVYGGLALYYSVARQFSEEELDLVGMLSDQVALATENAHLREQVEQVAAAAERNRLARDLHDAVTQAMFSAGLIADALPRLWEQDQAEGRRGLEELRQLMRGALAEMRALLVELRPAGLIEKQLGDLLRQLAEAVSNRTRVPIAVEVRRDEGTLPPAVQIALYRIAQEALNNIAKHAQAQHVLMDVRSQQGRIVLRVRDDGVGFDSRMPAASGVQAPVGAKGTEKRSEVRGATTAVRVVEGEGVSGSGHLGMAIMRERAASIGAAFALRSRPGKGTTLVVRWPGRTERPTDE